MLTRNAAADAGPRPALGRGCGETIAEIRGFRPAMTGRMTAKVIAPPEVGERCAVVGWQIGAAGRTLYSGTALYTEQGRLCGLATCTWILLKD